MNKFFFPNRVERVLHNVSAAEVLPGLLDVFGYQRVFIICSRSVNRRTDIVARITAALGERLAGLTDEVGEHAPVSNVLKAAVQVRDLRADVLLTIGGGSVMDFGKVAQLAVSENAFTKEKLYQFQMRLTADFEFVCDSTAPPAVRQIAIPTTLATSEWTHACTPIDEVTRLKARFAVPQGAPRAIIYDWQILGQTPKRLLLSTAIRGLDHSINTFCSVSPHPFTSTLAEKSIGLYLENLPRAKSVAPDAEALTNCQLATWYAGMGTMAIPHGFSHSLVHIVGPMASVSHSEAACVLMLAQARWIEEVDCPPYAALQRQFGRPGVPFSTVLHDLLRDLGLPSTLRDLGINDAQIEEMIPHALAHPNVTKNNVRPMETAEQIRAVMALAR